MFTTKDNTKLRDDPLHGKKEFPNINKDILFWEDPQEVPASMEVSANTKSGLDVEEKFRKFIKERRVEVNGTEALNEVIGMEELKQAVVDAIVAPQRLKIHRDLTLQAILIAGPPGCAKTTFLTQAAIMSAKVLGKPVSYFKLLYNEAQSAYVGESEKYISIIFETAREFVPSIILIDEADGFMRERNDKESEGTSRFKAALLTNIQGFCDNPGVLLLATTNLPYKIDEGYQRRFQERFLVKLPTREERIRLFRHFLLLCEETGFVDWDSLNFEYLADNSKRFSGDDIRNVIAKALRRKFIYNKAKEEINPVLMMEDVKRALSQSKATCKSELYAKLLKWGREMTTDRQVNQEPDKASRFKITKALMCICMCGC